MKTWSEAFNKYREKGCDLSDAAFRADQWEQRRLNFAACCNSSRVETCDCVNQNHIKVKFA